MNLVEDHDHIKPHARTRKLFDPYADRKLSATFPVIRSQTVLELSYTQKKSRRKTGRLYQTTPSPAKPNEEAKQQIGQPTYAQVLTTPQSTPKRGYLKRRSKIRSLLAASRESIKQAENNACSRSSIDTGPPCGGELLVSNSVDTVSFNKDGSVSMKTCPDAGSIDPHNRALNKHNPETVQRTVEFRDPAIVAVSANFQVRRQSAGSNHGGPIEVPSKSSGKEDLLSILFRPNVQQEDPAILGVHRVRQPSVSAIPLEALESCIIPTHAQTASKPSPVASKKNAMFDDPAIIYARRKSAVTTPSQQLPQYPQTGFWSAQENSLCNSNSFVTSNPFLDQKPVTASTHTYSSVCHRQIGIELPGYQGGNHLQYPSDTPMATIAVHASETPWISC